MTRGLLTSKEVVDKYSISYSTLTHYTNMGLLRLVAKKGNKRLYEEAQVKERLPKIQEMAKEGYPLRLIAQKINV